MTDAAIITEIAESVYAFPDLTRQINGPMAFFKELWSWLMGFGGGDILYNYVYNWTDGNTYKNDDGTTLACFYRVHLHLTFPYTKEFSASLSFFVRPVFTCPQRCNYSNNKTQ